MNILPRADEAIVPIEKLVNYVLDPMKSRGKWIAFREALGYDWRNADVLRANIKLNLKNFPAEYRGDKGYGDTYAVLMRLIGENGKTANVMTAWWLNDRKTGQMRMTSAYVKKRKGGNHD